MSELSLEEKLKQLFAYKAEWLDRRLFDLFTEPSYMPALTTPRPCVLIGGRGTGKTTVLRGLSYEGQFVLRGADPAEVRRAPFFGIYYRVHTARVSALDGPERTEQQWERLFGHYFNLVIVREVLRLVSWCEETLDVELTFDPQEIELLSASLGAPACNSLSELAAAVRLLLVQFEATINDVDDATVAKATSAGAPIELFFEILSTKPLYSGKTFFILLDEYENLKNYQQRVVNTLLKHAGPPFTFKIGVRELGWRDRSVIGGVEKLISPADYERVDISAVFTGDVFREFAVRVANERLVRLEQRPESEQAWDVRDLLPSISLEEEAKEFGVEERAGAILDRLGPTLTASRLQALRSLPPLQLFLFEYWAKAQGSTLEAMVADYFANPRRWETRYVNYKYSMVFALHTRGRRINKFYAGWDTFVQLAAGNIRYLLELLEASLLAHVRAENSLGPVTPRRQTVAAQDVGRTNLEELEGVDAHGAQLTRLVLSLGRVFQIMARQPSGHTPEVNQFYLVEESVEVDEAEDGESPVTPALQQLLTSAVTHLALLRSPGTKLLDEASIRKHDYMIHPVFAPFFQFSHRRKRKMQITPSGLWALVTQPHRGIPQVLARSRRSQDEDIPDQLLLFESFYGDVS